MGAFTSFEFMGFMIKMAEAREAAEKASTVAEKKEAIKLLDEVSATLGQNASQGKMDVGVITNLALGYKAVEHWDKAQFYMRLSCNYYRENEPKKPDTAQDFFVYSQICINMALDATQIAHTIMQDSPKYTAFIERLGKQIKSLEELKKD